MNPWLEQPALWPNVHHSLITALRDALAPLLRPRYFAAIEFQTLTTEPIEEGYLEVRLVPTGEVVTVIELLSHANKVSDREAYLKKREQLLENQVHFVELDLLRAGQPMPYTYHEHRAPGPYRFFIRHLAQPHQARLYSFNLRQPIPTFHLPLRPDDVEPLVNLGALLHDLYERAGYALILDYAAPPQPALSETDTAWAKEQLAQSKTQ